MKDRIPLEISGEIRPLVELRGEAPAAHLRLIPLRFTPPRPVSPSFRPNFTAPRHRAANRKIKVWNQVWNCRDINRTG